MILCKRYVDNIIYIFNCESGVEVFFLYLTSKHKNMQFSFEKEQDQNILFLDVLVTNDEAVIQTSVYCKKLIDLFTNFQSITLFSK